MSFFDYFSRFYLHMAFGPTYIITEVVSCLCVSLVFNTVHVKNPKDWLRLLLDVTVTFVVYLLLASLNNLIYEAAGTMSSSVYSRFYLWPALALLHTIYPNRNSKYIMRFTDAICVSTFIVYAISVSGIVGGMMTKAFGSPNSLASDITFYIVALAEVGITVMLKILSPFKFHYVKTVPVLLTLIIFLISDVYLILITIYLGEEEGTFTSVTMFLFLVTDILSYAIFYINVKNYNKILEYQSRTLKAESEKNQIEVAQSKYEELHQIRHDLKNQMGILQNLVEQKKYDELETYFSDLNENTRVSVDFVDCGNPLINDILNMEKSKARSHGIEIEHHISVSKNLPIRSQDLTSLLTNLLDNAIEAEVRYGKKEPIEIRIMNNANYLYVDVTNAIPDDIDTDNLLSLHTSKRERLNHGYGTKIIKNICKQYDGAYKFSVPEKGKFAFSGMLRLKGEENEKPEP